MPGSAFIIGQKRDDSPIVLTESQSNGHSFDPVVTSELQVFGCVLPARAAFQVINRSHYSSREKLAQTIPVATLDTHLLNTLIRSPFSKRAEETRLQHFPDSPDSFDFAQRLILATPPGAADFRIWGESVGLVGKERRLFQIDALKTQIRKGAEIWARLRTELERDEFSGWNPDRAELYRKICVLAFGSDDPQVVARSFTRSLQVEVRLAALHFIMDRRAFEELREVGLGRNNQFARKMLEQKIDERIGALGNFEVKPYCVNVWLSQAGYNDLERDYGRIAESTLGLNLGSEYQPLDGRVNLIRISTKGDPHHNVARHEEDHVLQQNFTETLPRFEADACSIQIRSDRSLKDDLRLDQERHEHLRRAEKIASSIQTWARGEIISFLMGGNFEQGCEADHLGLPVQSKAIGEMRTSILHRSDLTIDQKRDYLEIYDSAYRSMAKEIRLLQALIVELRSGEAKNNSASEIAAALHVIDPKRPDFVRRFHSVFYPSYPLDEVEQRLKEKDVALSGTLTDCAKLVRSLQVLIPANPRADTVTSPECRDLALKLLPKLGLSAERLDTQAGLLEQGCSVKLVRDLCSDIQVAAFTMFAPQVRMFYPDGIALAYTQACFNLQRLTKSELSSALEDVQLLLRVSETREPELAATFDDLQKRFLAKFGRQHELTMKAQELSSWV